MIKTLMIPVLVIGVLPLGGCIFLLDDDDDDCLFEATGDGNSDALEAAEYFRDPNSGQCELRSTGGGGPIDPCGTPGPQEGAPEPDPVPVWGQCYVACEGFDEATCLAEPGCRTAYIADDNGDEPPPTNERYYGCWTVSPGDTGFAEPECETLSAQDCSLFDTCAAVHSTPCVGSPDFCLEPDVGFFMACRDEGPVAVGCEAQDEIGCVGDATCEPIYEGSDCTCDAVSCDCATWTFVDCQDAT